jgi:predicted porin
MKKTFIAAAVGVAMAAPLSAFAAATLYGQAHGSIDFVDDGENSQVALSSNSSRIGVKGSENVGGMDVVYGIEWHLSLTDTNDGGKKELAARNRYVGLKSADFGTIVVGRMDTPSKKLGRSVDLFHSTQMGENRNVVSYNGGDERRDNVIQWNSNNMSGLKVAVQYSTDILGDRMDDNDVDALGVSAVYTTGDIMVGVAYDDAADLVDLYRLVGSYTMGDIKLVGFYETADGSELHKLLGTPAADFDDAKSWGIGASMKDGPNTFKIAYYDASNAQGYVDQDGDLISVGVDHALSSSTMIYVVAADGSDFIKPAGAGHDDATAGRDTSGVSFGIRTKF